MKDIPEGLRAKVKKYSLMVAWWYVHETDPAMEEKRTDVLSRIEQTENELRLSGVKSETLGEIIDKAKEFVKLTVGEMSDKQLETLCKLIFGQNIKMTVKEMKDPSMVGLDTVKYAEQMKERQGKLNV